MAELKQMQRQMEKEKVPNLDLPSADEFEDIFVAECLFCRIIS